MINALAVRDCRDMDIERLVLIVGVRATLGLREILDQDSTVRRTDSGRLFQGISGAGQQVGIVLICRTGHGFGLPDFAHEPSPIFPPRPLEFGLGQTMRRFHRP